MAAAIPAAPLFILPAVRSGLASILLFFALNGMAAEALAAARTVGGAVAGLAGTGLVLQNNDGGDLAVDADGTFVFDTVVEDGQTYRVAVAAQPAYPDQWCNIYNASGTVSGADVSDIEVVCVTGLYNVVDTNQDACYVSASGDETACTGTGYDADYAGSASDYTVSADGTYVTDNVTGLIWTQTPDLDDDGVVDANDKLTQPEAVAYCSALDTGGFEWRLPDIKELYSLIDFRGGDPSAYQGTDTSILTPFIDDDVFQPGFGDTSAQERLIDGQYATTTIYVSPEGTLNGAATMFGVNFVDGRIKGYPYNDPPHNPKTFYVHCVAGNASYGENDFVDNRDGTVSDFATGLMWEQEDYQSSNFEDAVSQCKGAATAGHTDWRLPNVKELQSIVDYSRAPDADPSGAAVDPVFDATAITNEGGADDWGFYWASTTHADYLGNGRTADYIAFGRALGYYKDPATQIYSLVDVHGAGAQRSVNKTTESSPGTESADLGYGTFYYKGPQGDIQRIDNMVFCVRDDDSNQSPVVTANEGLAVSEGETGATIDNTVLDTNDADNGAGELTYTLDSQPQNGTLKLDDADLNIDDTFTQAQIDAGLLSFSHDGSETTTDSFGFSVADPSGAGVSGQTFNIDVAPVNDPPAMDVNLGLSVKQGDTGTVIANTELSASDPDHSADELTYTVAVLPREGNLLLDGVALELYDTFTQADIDGGLVSFDIDGSTSESDSFGFDLADAGSPPLSVTGQIFQIAILAPLVVNTANDDETAGDSLCTLREAINNANADADTTSGDCPAGLGADEITFAGDYTINLSGSQLPVVTSDVAITGKGSTNTFLDGGGKYRAFEVNGADVVLNLSDLTVQNARCSTISGVCDGEGGGAYVDGSGTLIVANCQFIDNVAAFYGGGVFVGDGTLEIRNSMFSGNSTYDDSESSGGGAIYNESGTVTITGSTFSGNSAASPAGGGAIRNQATVTVANSTVSGNSAANGGGIYNKNTGELSAVNSTIAGNTASSGNGGGIYNDGVLHLENSILADSTSGSDCYNAGGDSIATNTNNLIETNASAGNMCGTPAYSADPMLDDLADNGGFTETTALSTGSPAIDGGDDAVCAAAPVNNVDQRGFTRPQGTQCDIGAYEYSGTQIGSVFTVNSDADTDDGYCDLEGQGTGNLDCTLREAVNAANSDGEASTIDFDDNYTVTLDGSQLPAIDSETAIAGNGSSDTILQASACDPVALPGDCTPAGYRVLEVGDSGDLTIDGVTVRHGQCDGSCDGDNKNSGGGIYSAGSLTVTDSAVVNNVAADYGSAICNTGALSVVGSEFSDNYTPGDGTVANFGSASIETSTFSDNATNIGGGVYSDLDTTLVVANSTFAGNDSLQGGGVHIRGEATIVNSTFAFNTASGVGKAVHNWNGTMSLYNNIMADNGGDGDAVCYNEGTLSANVNNLIDDGTCGATLTADPLLAFLSDNGGPTQTIALLTGSPALDAGDTSTCGDDPVDSLDQRGEARLTSGTCDIGAFEAPENTTSISLAASPDPATYGDSATLTATLAATGQTPDGPVYFFDDSASVLCGPVSLSGLEATCETPSLDAGTHIFSAVFGGDDYFIGSEGTLELTVEKADQTIAFDDLPDRLATDGPFTVAATASSGLDVAFSSQTTSVCTVAGDAVSLLGAGECAIMASQEGDTNYSAASDVVQAFTVRPEDYDVDLDDDGLIEIDSLADLDEMRNDLAGTGLYGLSTGCPGGGCIGYELTCDLDFDTNGDGTLDAGDDYWNDGQGWSPVGVSDEFTGTFDGNGYEILNLMVNTTSSIAGLFGYVSGGNLNNLGLTGSLTSVTGNQDVGILVGGALSNTEINGCYSAGTVYAHSGGGLVGSLYSGTVSSSFSTATVACSGGYQCGGLAGAVYGSGTMENTYAGGAVTGATSIGGLAGALYTGAEVVNSYGFGSVAGDSETGGLFGTVYGSPTVTASYWDTESTGQSTSAGDYGTGLAKAEMQCPAAPDDTACAPGTTIYEGWSAETWDFGDSDEYPKLIVGGQVYRDSDGDGAWDFEDAFPDDPDDWQDTDNDGVGDNTDPDPDNWNDWDDASVYVWPDGCGGIDYCFTTVQEAIDAAVTGKPVKVPAGSFDEAVLVQKDGEIIAVVCGYDDSYTSPEGTSAINSLTLETGTLEVENLVLEGDGSDAAEQSHTEIFQSNSNAFQPVFIDAYAEEALSLCLEDGSEITSTTRELLEFLTEHGALASQDDISASDFLEESRERLDTLIHRFYLTALDRYPAPPARDVIGNLYLRKNADQLEAYRFIALGTGEILFLGQEYEEKSLSDKEFIIDCYQAFLERTPDEWELSEWLQLGLDRDEFLSVVAGSEEFSEAFTE